eukprot:Skav226952  [mRNA]  locus=scaffold2024:181548:184649:- [translate_table: standard]
MHHTRVEPRREDSWRDVYIFHKRQLKEDFGHLYAKLGFTIQVQQRLGCTALQSVVACFLGTDNDEVEKETLKIASWLVKRGALGAGHGHRQDHSDIRYAVAGHSAYSMLAQVQRDMRTSKYAENWAPYLRTAGATGSHAGLD